MRRVGVVSACLLALSATAASAPAGPAPRLEGTWTVSMRFTVAEGLRDRRVGQRVVETWILRPRCSRGPCDVGLLRAGRTITLSRVGSTYRGTTSFPGAVTCNGRTYPKGTLYVESWVVRVPKSTPGARGARAVRIAGVGVTVGRSRDALPCPPIVSREAVVLSGVPAR
jgi:hypothetical protein